MEFGGENEEKKKSIDFPICVANTIYNTYTLPTQTSYTSQAIYELLFS